MKVLIVGGGGREHAIAWKVSQNKSITKIYCAPGNAGISQLAECVDIAATDMERLVEFAKINQVDFTIVGMDDPLVMGIVDVFQAEGLKIFGPSKEAARIEGSKSFSKDLMKKYNIPTASYEVFNDPNKAKEYLIKAEYPIVLKADGLALGKGVLICNTLEEALCGVNQIMIEKKFGSAGNKLVIEEFMTGPEVSVLAFCDGEHILPMTSAQDHKRAKDGDQGLNTGGMGTFSPSPHYTESLAQECMQKIYLPTIKAMKEEGCPFTGILFVGLMLTEKGVKVLEYNARFGDPETQVVLPRMKSDIIEVMRACLDQRLDQIELEFEDNAAVCVVLASDGYPEQYVKGFIINGLEKFKENESYYVFHAGTKMQGEDVITNGGRVLGVTAKGKDLVQAKKNAYEAVTWVDYKNKYYRTDIGEKVEK